MLVVISMHHFLSLGQVDLNVAADRHAPTLLFDVHCLQLRAIHTCPTTSAHYQLEDSERLYFNNRLFVSRGKYTNVGETQRGLKIAYEKYTHLHKRPATAGSSLTVPEVPATPAPAPQLDFQPSELLRHFVQIRARHGVSHHALQCEVIVAMFLTLDGPHLRRTDAPVFELPGAPHNPQVAFFVLVLQALVFCLDQCLDLAAKLAAAAQPAKNRLGRSLGALIGQVLVQKLRADPLEALPRTHHQPLGTLLSLVVLLLRDQPHRVLVGGRRGARALSNAATVEDFGVTVDRIAAGAALGEVCERIVTAAVRTGGVRREPELLGVLHRAAQGTSDNAADTAPQLMIHLLFAN